MNVKLKIKPRDYQLEAVKWALEHDGSVVVMPTGSGKTLIAILWSIELLRRRQVNRIIFLEPTRILVEQVAKYISKATNLQAIPIHGKYPKEKRIYLWKKARIAVATPETALSDYKYILKEGFDGVVVDECHHTTGKDAYAKFMQKMTFRRRLGLSAYIPHTRVNEIKKYIGVIRSWDWRDKRIRKYVPEWIGEVYEAELNDYERTVLEKLEETRIEYSGKLRGLVQLAIRWFVRDGALALEESLDKQTLLSAILSHIRPLLSDKRIRKLHKLNALYRILRDHEGFSKAIIFVDRVIVAKYLAKVLNRYNPVVIHGKAHGRIDIRKVLEEAYSSKTRIVISTSAGEEGLDLPEADLLIIWSNVASPLRFIQRHGRILRLSSKLNKLKFVTYIVTPDTPDMDSLVDSLEAAKKAGVDIPVEESVIESLWKRTTRSRILSIIEGRPLPLEWISEILLMPIDLVKKELKRLIDKGEIIYIHTYMGKVYSSLNDIEVLEEQYVECLKPDPYLRARVKAWSINGKELRSVMGTYLDLKSKLLHLIRKHMGFKKLLFTIQVPLEGGAYQIVNLVYSFPITRDDVLDIVLRNAFSVKNYLKHIKRIHDLV